VLSRVPYYLIRSAPNPKNCCCKLLKTDVKLSTEYIPVLFSMNTFQRSSYATNWGFYFRLLLYLICTGYTFYICVYIVLKKSLCKCRNNMKLIFFFKFITCYPCSSSCIVNKLVNLLYFVSL
jgi:hypothetical protein